MYQMVSLSATGVYLGVTILLSILSVVAHTFDYDGERFDQISSDVERERWENVCEEYGQLMSQLYISIDDYPNYFEDTFEDEDQTAEFVQKVFSNFTEFEELNDKMSLVEKPKIAANRCWIGSFFSRFSYAGAILFLGGAILVEDPTITIGLLVTSLLLFLIALLLTLLYIYYRIQLRRYATNQAFMS